MHYALSLVGLEESLSVCGAIENDQLLWFGSFLVLRADPGETWGIPVCLVAGYDEQGGRLELVGGAVRRRAEEYHALDLTWPGGD